MIGFDGIDFGKYWEPELTTMARNKAEFGEKAFDMLYSNMRKGNTSYHEYNLELIVRNSTSECRQ